MSFPAQTFSSITELLSYINTYIIPNGVAEIEGTEHNNVENALANFIITYTLNSGLAAIVNGGGVVTLASPITIFSAAPASIKWLGNVQNEYYVVNATGVDIAASSGFSYIDPYQNVATSFPARTTIHLAKASNGNWIQINNVGGGGGSLPPMSGEAGRALFNNGSSAFWGDPVMQIAANDPNWVNGTTWQNGFAQDNPSFSSTHFLLFWNDNNRFLLQNGSPPEWQYVSQGFQVLETGWDAQLFNVNMFLFFKGINS